METIKSNTLAHDKALSFMLAGRAVVTIQSEKTGKHYTYKIQVANDNPDVFYVRVRAGEMWVYIGYVHVRNNQVCFKASQTKNNPGYEPKSAAAIHYVLGNLYVKGEAPHVIIRHENTCGKCGRALTHPESIDTGIGPVCKGYVIQRAFA